MTLLNKTKLFVRSKWLLLLLTLGVSICLAVVVTLSPTNVGWRIAEKNQSISEIQDSKKVVYFYKPDCPDCRKMTPKIMAYNGSHNLHVVAVDTNKLTSKEINTLGLRFVPAVKVGNSGIVEINSLNDYISHVRT